MDLQQFLLRNHVTQAVVNVFVDQQFNFDSFMELTSKDLADMGIKMGPAKTIMKLVHVVKASVAVDDSESNDFLNNKLAEFDRVSKNSTRIVPDTVTNVEKASVQINRSDGDDFFNDDEDDLNNYSIHSSIQNVPVSASTPDNEFAGTDLLSDNSIELNHSTHNVAQKRISNLTILDHRVAESLKTTKANDDIIRNNEKVSNFIACESVKNFIYNHPQGLQITTAIENGTFEEKHRKNLVRILMAEVIQQHGHYPKYEILWAVAKRLVEDFPQLRCSETTDGCEHYFDPITRKGFFVYRLENARKNLITSQKKYTVKKKNQTETEKKYLGDDDSTKANIALLNNLLPNQANKSLIKNAMEQTFDARRSWINLDSPSITDIVNKYPRMLDYNGELVDFEYTLMQKGSIQKLNALITFFPTTYTAKIIEYCRSANPLLYNQSASIIDHDFRAILIMASLFPRANFIKESEVSVQFPNQYLIRIVPDGINLEEFIAEDFVNEDQAHDVGSAKRIKRTPKTPRQPYLVAVQHHNSHRYSFFIIGDRKITQLDSRTTPLSAITLLYRYHYVFNTVFEPSLVFFYNFLDNIIFKVPGNKLLSSVASVNISILNYNPENRSRITSD